MEYYYPGHPAGGSKVEQDVGLLGDLPLQQPPLRADLASPQFALVCDGKAADQHRDRDGDDHHPADGAQPAKYLTHYCLRKSFIQHLEALQIYIGCEPEAAGGSQQLIR